MRAIYIGTSIVRLPRLLAYAMELQRNHRSFPRDAITIVTIVVMVTVTIVTTVSIVTVTMVTMVAMIANVTVLQSVCVQKRTRSRRPMMHPKHDAH